MNKLEELQAKLQSLEDEPRWQKSLIIFGEIASLIEQLPEDTKSAAWAKVAYDLLARSNWEKQRFEVKDGRK